ncbi:MAG: DUF364 domain-containing protein, partial [Magnetospirillum sp. WYHS-4]
AGLALGPGELPRAAASWLLPGSGAIVLSSSALAELTLPALLESCPASATVALAGAATPLSSRLLSYGFHRLQGVVVTDPAAAAEAIARDAAWPALAPFTRPAVVV